MHKHGPNPWRGVMKAVLEDKSGNLRALDYIPVSKLFKSCGLNSLKIWVYTVLPLFTFFI